MRGFFSGFVSRRRRQGLVSVEAAAERRSSRGSTNGSTSPDVDVRIDIRRDSPPGGVEAWAHAAHEDVGAHDDEGAGRSAMVGAGNEDVGAHDYEGAGRSTMVGAGNFGVLACSKDDFMQIQASVMDALSRAEAQFGDDDEFADAIMEEIDVLFDEFEMLKQLLVRAHRGDTDASIERDALPLKHKLQHGINGIVARIEERERRPAHSKRKSRSRRHAADAAGAADGAGRGIEKLTVEGDGDNSGAAAHGTVRTTSCTEQMCKDLETVHLA